MTAIREDFVGQPGQDTLLRVLALLCRLGDDDRLELKRCADPSEICRLMSYLGCLHSEPRRESGGWTVSIWHGHNRELPN